MRTNCCAVVAALTLAVTSPSAVAAVYKCTDASGKTTYQAQPCPEASAGAPLKVDAQPAPKPAGPARPAPPARLTPNPGWDVMTSDGEVAPPAAPAPALESRTATAPERVQAPLLRLSFDLLSTDGRRLPWTNAGPKGGNPQAGQARDGAMNVEEGGPVALDATGREAYTFGGNGSHLVWMPRGLGGPQQELTLPARLPRMSWASTIAWDTRAGVLAFASGRSDGYFYRYDTRRHAWLGAVPLRNRNLVALASDAANGSFIGITDQLELVSYDAQGQEQRMVPLAGVLPPHARTMAGSLDATLHLTVRDGVAAIVKISRAKVTHIWTYAMASGIAQLTYKD